MGEFASNGKANAGLTTGIIGTTLGGLWALGAGNGNGGILGGLLGGNNCQMSPVSALQSEVAMLRAEKYSDRNTADVYSAVRGEYKDLLEKWITPLSDEACRNRERIAVLETQVKCENEKALLREQIVREQLNRRIDQCCCETNGRINQLNQSVYQMSQTLGSITTTVIPRTAICPEVMPRYNTWTAPTDPAPATQPVTGNIDVS
jgi:hypothetical protein